MSCPSEYSGKCYCGAITWKAPAKGVNFTSLCHCHDCQTVTGSSYGSTSLMIYDPKGVTFTGDEPKVYHSQSEQGNSTQRGFCGTCGSVLFNHVSEVSSIGDERWIFWENGDAEQAMQQGKEDEHWAMRTGSMASPPKMQKEIFMKSKPEWVPSLVSSDSRFEKMPSS